MDRVKVMFSLLRTQIGNNFCEILKFKCIFTDIMYWLKYWFVVCMIVFVLVHILNDTECIPLALCICFVFCFALQFSIL